MIKVKKTWLCSQVSTFQKAGTKHKKQQGREVYVFFFFFAFLASTQSRN